MDCLISSAEGLDFLGGSAFLELWPTIGMSSGDFRHGTGNPSSSSRPTDTTGGLPGLEGVRMCGIARTSSGGRGRGFFATDGNLCPSGPITSLLNVPVGNADEAGSDLFTIPCEARRPDRDR